MYSHNNWYIKKGQTTLTIALSQIENLVKHAALGQIKRIMQKQTITNIEERPDPRQVNVLILFLSPWGKDCYEGVIDGIIEGKDFEVVKDLDNKLAKSPWLMPLKAIKYHLDRLKKVILIPSKDTAKLITKFQDLIKSLMKTDFNYKKKPEFEVVSINKFNSSLSLPQYVDVESAKQQNDILNDILHQLTEKDKIKCEDIIIDVTGGRKVSSVAGAIVALGRGHRIQYVTNDYKVMEYDITIGEDDR